jgi:chloramphenicol-sensitive protein RarD
MNKGIWYAIAAYGIWGLFPLYWKPLHQVPALELIGHRIGWSFVLLFAIILLTRQWPAFRAVAFAPRTLRTYSVAAALISVNWTAYVWAVNHGYVVESSLGYFINPLLSILLGVVFLRERLRPWQWLPVGLATLGVLIVALAYGFVPWLALTMASSFGLYGLVKKTGPLNSFFGLTLETGILFVPALGYLLYLERIGQGAFLHIDTLSNWLMAGAGLVTTVPLLLFSSAAQRVPLAVIGILQYITPTMLFLLGVFVYKEDFSTAQLIGFGLVWAALVVFSLEGFLARTRTKQPGAVVAEP